MSRIFNSKVFRKNKTAIFASVLLPVLLIGISYAITASSHILQDVASISVAKMIDIIMTAVAIGAAAFIMSFAIKNLKGMDPKEAGVALAVVALIAPVIVFASWILQIYQPLAFDPMQFIIDSAAIAIAIVAFSIALILINKAKLTPVNALKAAISVIIVAAVMMVSSHILNLGSYGNFPTIEWALGAGLAVILFAAALAILGFISPPTIIAGAIGLVIVAVAIVVFANILNAGLPKELFKPGGILYLMADTFAYFLNKMVDVFGRLVNVLLPLIQIFVDAIIEIAKVIGDVIIGIVEAIADLIARVVESIFGGIAKIIDSIAKFTRALGDVNPGKILAGGLAMGAALLAIAGGLGAISLATVGVSGAFYETIFTGIERLSKLTNLKFDAKKFVKNMGALGEGLTEFADEAPGLSSMTLNTDAVDVISKNIGHLATGAKALEKVNLTHFKTNMEALGAGISLFADQIEDSDMASAAMSVFGMSMAIKNMVEVAQMEFEVSEDFIPKLEALAKGLMAFSNIIKAPESGIADVFGFGEADQKSSFVATMASAIESMTNVAKMDLSTLAFDFPIKLQMLGMGLMAFANQINASEEQMEKMREQGKGLYMVAKGLDEIASIAERIIAVDTITLKTKTRELAEGMLGFADGLNEEKLLKIKSGVKHLEQIATDFVEGGSSQKMMEAGIGLAYLANGMNAITSASQGASMVDQFVTAIDNLNKTLDNMVNSLSNLSKTVKDDAFIKNFKDLGQTLLLISVIDPDAFEDVIEKIDKKNEVIAKIISKTQEATGGSKGPTKEDLNKGIIEDQKSNVSVTNETPRMRPLEQNTDQELLNAINKLTASLQGLSNLDSLVAIAEEIRSKVVDEFVTSSANLRS